MNIARNIRLLLLGLLLSVALVPVAWANNARVAELKSSDPNGFILTITAVLVVFSALLMLVMVFKLIGRVMMYFSGKAHHAQHKVVELVARSERLEVPSHEAMVAISLALNSERGDMSDETTAVIAMALRNYLAYRHDEESYVLTIKPRQSSWQNHLQSMRQYHKR